jgi:hypothetical protein
MRGDYIGTLEKTFSFYLAFSLLTSEQKKNDINYHHYYSIAPSGWPRATDRGMYNSSRSEAGRTWA